jgi:phage terminase large subunit
VAAVATDVITIPYRPRFLQRVIHEALEAHRWAVVVCHRRFGKTVLAVNQLQKAALLCTKERPRFGYIAPTYRQGKAAAWDFCKHYASTIPGAVVHESELKIDYPNGGQVRIYGADAPDSLRGIYLDGVVLDEFGMMAPKVFGEVIRPLLTDRQGWALFIGTPNGKNEFYDIAKRAQREDGWFFAAYKASDTNLIPAAELVDAKRSMTEDEYAQEFECSFEASVKGAVFARELQAIREEGRITRVSYDPMLLVDTSWDLGRGDATAIWFSQTSPAGEERFIDYHELSGHVLSDHIGIVRAKPYAYGRHIAPHDIEVKEYGDRYGRSRKEIAAGLGITFEVSPRPPVKEDAINAARMLLRKAWFDEDKCAHGLETLQNYKWKPETTAPTSAQQPVHDWASHGADALMTRAMTHYTPSKRELDKHRMKSLVAMATQEADARRAAGPTGETLAEAERRIAIASRQSRDIDPADVRKRPQMGRRGGW